MATLTRTYKPRLWRLALTKRFDETLEKLILRRCMVVSVSLIVIGLGIPLLMTPGVLPVNFLLGLFGFALIATGGVLALTLCGKI